MWRLTVQHATPYTTFQTRRQVIPVSDHILGTMAGGAADCTFWLRYLGMQVWQCTRKARLLPVRCGSQLLWHAVHTIAVGAHFPQTNATLLPLVDTHLVCWRCWRSFTTGLRVFTMCFSPVALSPSYVKKLPPTPLLLRVAFDTNCSQCKASVFEARNNRPMSVATAARVLADTLMGQRGRGLSVGTMVMGHDQGRTGAAELYYVDSEGARVKGQYFSVG